MLNVGAIVAIGLSLGRRGRGAGRLGLCRIIIAEVPHSRSSRRYHRPIAPSEFFHRLEQLTKQGRDRHPCKCHIHIAYRPYDISCPSRKADTNCYDDPDCAGRGEGEGACPLRGPVRHNSASATQLFAHLALDATPAAKPNAGVLVLMLIWPPNFLGSPAGQIS